MRNQSYFQLTLVGCHFDTVVAVIVAAVAADSDNVVDNVAVGEIEIHASAVDSVGAVVGIFVVAVVALAVDVDGVEIEVVELAVVVSSYVRVLVFQVELFASFAAASITADDAVVDVVDVA